MTDFKTSNHEQLLHSKRKGRNDMKNEYEPYFGWCDVDGCNIEGCNGGGCWRETGYWTVCQIHSAQFREGKPQPQMKQSAIDRENSRDENGCLPIPLPSKEQYRKIYNHNLTKKYPPYSGEIIGAGKSPSIKEQIAELQKHLPQEQEEKTERLFTLEDLAKFHWHGWVMRERYNGPDRHGYEDKLPKNWGEMDYDEHEQWFYEQLLKEKFGIDITNKS